MHDEPEEPISVISLPLILFLISILLFIALLLREKELALFSTLVLGLTGCMKIWSLFSLHRLTCMPDINKVKAFPGETITLKVHAVNQKMLPVLLRVNLPPVSGGLKIKEGFPGGCETGLLWHQKTEFSWEFLSTRRGVHKLGPITMGAGDFLGFFKKERTGAAVSIIVYPKIFPMKNLSLTKKDLFGKTGKRSPVYDPVYILGTREYQHWQPARYIHWKASARHDNLQEKVFDPSEQEKVLLAIDSEGFSENSAEEKFEETLEAAASLAVHLDGRGFATGLVTNAELCGRGKTVVQPGKNPVQLSMMLETMARMKMHCERSLVEAINRGLSLSWGMTCVIFAYSGREIMVDGAFLQHRGVPCTGIAAVNPEESSSGKCPVIHSLDAFLLNGRSADE